MDTNKALMYFYQIGSVVFFATSIMQVTIFIQSKEVQTFPQVVISIGQILFNIALTALFIFLLKQTLKEQISYKEVSNEGIDSEIEKLKEELQIGKRGVKRKRKTDSQFINEGG